MKKIKTALIGLGNIGALYDIDDPSDKPRAHLKAILDHDDFEFAALVDPDMAKKERVSKHFSLNDDLFFSSINEIPNDLKFDLGVFACPPSGRLEQLQLLQKRGIKFCMFEKPFATSLQEAKNIEEFCNQNSINALVNFHRRYDDGLLSFKENLPKNEVPEKIIVHYTKGIKNYGSHAIDLLMDYFGDVKAVQSISTNDASDPLIDGALYFENGVVAHVIAHETDYDLFEFEFFYKDKKFTLSQGTTQKFVQHARENLIYKNYSHLGEHENMSIPKKISGMAGLYDDISSFFNKEKHILKGCDLTQAKKGMEIIENLLKSAEDKSFIEI